MCTCVYIQPAHWMQRDAYDTGKRNHMQQHNEIANKRFKIKEQQRVCVCVMIYMMCVCVCVCLY